MNNACKAHGKRVAGALQRYQGQQDQTVKRIRRLPPLHTHADSTNTTGGLGMSETHDTSPVMLTPPVPVVEPAQPEHSQGTLSPEKAAEEHNPVRRDGRPNRKRKQTKDTRFRDFVDTTEELGNIELLDHPPPAPPLMPSAELTIQSIPDGFGLRRLYYEQPQHIPKAPSSSLLSKATFESSQKDSFDQLAADTLVISPQESATHESTINAPLGLCHNNSEFLLADWFTRNNRNTVKSFKELVDILQNRDFKAEELPSSSTMLSHLSALGRFNAEDTLPDWLSDDAGWKNSSVTISVPFPNKPPVARPETHPHFLAPGTQFRYHPKAKAGGGPLEFTVHNFYHRSLTEILRTRLQRQDFQQLHIHPYELRWKPGTDKADVRVYGETYSSPEFLKEHIAVQNLELPSHLSEYSRHVIGMIYFSDGTHLSAFGDAHFWPGYMQFANNTKYDRISPSSHLTEHIAYFQKLPVGVFKAFVRRHDDRKDISALLTHCKRELFQAQWECLLDQDFVEAYRDGILIKCYDGIIRLFFPRIFVYCADYPEKVLLATIKSLSDYPCPNCLVKLKDVPELGSPEDMATRGKVRVDNARRRQRIAIARNQVYVGGLSLQSIKLEKYLNEGSYIITQSAFSKKLGDLGFNFFSMFRTEILHEWSSNGEGKKLHQHLLRILDTTPKSLSMLDTRYTEIPTFGTDIRKFRANVSEASFQAAHDVEQIIKCAIPVYEDLLPEPHNTRILDMLYLMAEFHVLAKLRLHTDHTLHLLDTVLTNLGTIVREFVELTCTQFKTLELKHEAMKRLRHTIKLLRDKEAALQAKNSDVSKDVSKQTKSPEATSVSDAGQVDKNNSQCSTWTETSKKTGKGKAKAGKEKSQAGKEKAQAGKEKAQAGKEKAQAGKEKAQSVKGKAKEKNAKKGLETIVEHSSKGADEIGTDGSDLTRQETSVNLNSSKFHALGDVARCIREVGTTDSYTAEIGEGEHRTGKRRYLRTDGREYTKQLTEHDRREARLRRIREQIQSPASMKSSDEYLLESDMTVHHEMGKSQNNTVKLVDLMVKNINDPSVRDFPRRLKQHLLLRLLALVEEELKSLGQEIPLSLSTEDLNPDAYLRVVFQTSETIYRHNVFRLNYTSYDVRRQRDVLTPNTDHKDVMVLAEDTATDRPKFKYARIIGAFHCNVAYNNREIQLSESSRYRRLEFLWVRWFRTVEDNPRRLECIELIPFHEESSVGFLNPDDVIRAVHIMPRFSKGLIHPDRKGGRSRICHDGSDYHQYNIGRFSNGDLYMRSKWGLGVGHQYSHEDAPARMPPLPEYHVSFNRDPKPSSDIISVEEEDNSDFGENDTQDMAESKVTTHWYNEALDSDGERSEEHENDQEEDYRNVDLGLDDEVYAARYG